MTIKIEKARKFGNSITVPLSSFLELNKDYIIQDTIIHVNNKEQKCVIIKEIDPDSILFKLESVSNEEKNCIRLVDKENIK